MCNCLSSLQTLVCVLASLLALVSGHALSEATRFVSAYCIPHITHTKPLTYHTQHNAHETYMNLHDSHWKHRLITYAQIKSWEYY